MAQFNGAAFTSMASQAGSAYATQWPSAMGPAPPSSSRTLRSVGPTGGRPVSSPVHGTLAAPPVRTTGGLVTQSFGNATAPLYRSRPQSQVTADLPGSTRATTYTVPMPANTSTASFRGPIPASSTSSSAYPVTKRLNVASRRVSVARIDDAPVPGRLSGVPVVRVSNAGAASPFATNGPRAAAPVSSSSSWYRPSASRAGGRGSPARPVAERPHLIQIEPIGLGQLRASSWFSTLLGASRVLVSIHFGPEVDAFPARLPDGPPVDIDDPAEAKQALSQRSHTVVVIDTAGDRSADFSGLKLRFLRPALEEQFAVVVWHETKGMLGVSYERVGHSVVPLKDGGLEGKVNTLRVVDQGADVGRFMLMFRYATTPFAPIVDLEPNGVQRSQAAVRWSDSNKEVGSDPSAYVVRLREAEGAWDVLDNQFRERSFTFTGLKGNTLYEVNIGAVNEVGVGDYGVVEFRTGACEPGPVVRVSADLQQDSSVVLSWELDDDGGSPPTGFLVSYRQGEAVGELGDVPPRRVGSHYVTELSDLDGNTEYVFVVAGVNSIGVGTSGASDPIQTPPSPPTACGQPVVREVGMDRATLEWNGPASSGGAAVTGYTIFSNGVPVCELAVPPQQVLAQYEVTGLMPDTEHVFHVRARNEIGEGPVSPPSVPVRTTRQYDEVYIPGG
eukprot:CAMPEP_0204325280 /NCGR_PEP_ID=MMETSP0469-20131031/10883_1 /ASSEMBLY_ACC=CAM_ASM_000384 /TAXON_ID=2969 /ORGANISM="Oxyrrhis marina" /LENGTH=671 /DNA_ID=CAMNT_0051307091 /DNA_START=5 /DNA_END=2020 /DNA_ORIENTATION=-